ncbi:hypothetical protein [Pseudomonas aeruginosa]|uniref:hypothetical protein n=1 Tax=Pseudomonas aeruginosa TaxID=287 RepID=UPI00211A06C2|nr:hypothetical protein [Pseudomonas aeruginosa]
MNTHEFITKQIDQQLQRDGFSGRVSHAVAGESLDYYTRTARFKKGVMQDLLAFAKKRAKELAKSPQKLRTCPQQAGNPDNCGFPSGGGRHEENTRSSGF